MSVATTTAVAIAVGAAGAASSVYAANKAAGAAKTAAGMQQQSVNRAQDFAQQAYQQQRQGLLPYREMGQNALAQLQNRVLGPGGTMSQNPGALGLQSAPGWQGGGFSLASLRPGGGGMPGGPQGQMPMNQQPPPGMSGGGAGVPGAWTMPDGTQYPNGVPGYQAGTRAGPSPNAWTMPDGTQYTNGVPGYQAGTRIQSPGQMQQPMGQPPGAPGMGGPQGPQIPQGGMVTVQDDTGATRQVPAAQAPLYAQKGFTVKAM